MLNKPWTCEFHHTQAASKSEVGVVGMEPVLHIGVGNCPTCVVAVDVHRIALNVAGCQSEMLCPGCVFCLYNCFVFEMFVNYIDVGCRCDESN